MSCCIPVQAAADALQAHRLHPSWPKPLYRYVGAASRRLGSLRALMRAALLARSCHASQPLPPPAHCAAALRLLVQAGAGQAGAGAVGCRSGGLQAGRAAGCQGF
jgi:hypothetical protein